MIQREITPAPTGTRLSTLWMHPQDPTRHSSTAGGGYTWAFVETHKITPGRLSDIAHMAYEIERNESVWLGWDGKHQHAATSGG